VTTARTYSKAIVAAVPAGLAVVKILVDAFGSAHVGPVDYTAVVVAIAAALGVYAVPNVDSEPMVTVSRVIGTITPAGVVAAPVIRPVGAADADPHPLNVSVVPVDGTATVTGDHSPPL